MYSRVPLLRQHDNKSSPLLRQSIFSP